MIINCFYYLQCNYGHCQITFHPSCARSIGLFMNVKAVAGKFQHRAYCEKHSVEQKAKVFLCFYDTGVSNEVALSIIFIHYCDNL